jgi:hypothetical protein
MKKKVIVFLTFLSTLIFISILFTNIFPFSSGYIGVTNKGGEGIGCICHGTSMPTPSVSVFFTGPDSVEVEQTVIYKIKVAHGPAVVGGFDAAVYAGRLDTLANEPGVRRDSATGDLTHRYPKTFTNDTVYWSFKYTAPGSEQIDTLYAVGNSTNNDSTSDGDEWNFSSNFTIAVHNPIGISNSNIAVHDFLLYQNYPNPFNPVTKIKYSLGNASYVRLEVFDISGKLVSILKNDYEKGGVHNINFDGTNKSSGIYIYRISVTENAEATNGSIEIKKMVLIK